MNTVLAQVTTTYTTTTTTTDGDPTAAIIFSLVAGLFWIAIAVVSVMTLWKIFVKAGQPGWAALIPIYNVVVLLNLTGRSGWWTLGLFVPFLSLFVGIRIAFDLARVFGQGVGFGFGLLLLSPIFALILAFGGARYVGPNSHNTAQLSGGFAPAPAA